MSYRQGEGVVLVLGLDGDLARRMARDTFYKTVNLGNGTVTPN